jgi:ABC-2 type transport system permease protein
MFILNIVGQLWPPAGWFRPFSVFFYYQPQKIWLKGAWWVDLNEAWSVNPPEGPPWLLLPVVVVLLVAGLAGYLAAWRIFTTRDLPAPL